MVIVGGGLAGCSLAEQLRREGFAGAIHLIDGEPAAYDRPPLSKDLFADWFGLDEVTLVTGSRFAALDVDARFGRRAIDLDAPARTVTLDDGSIIAGSVVVLATGSRARALPVAGGGSALTLHMFADAAILRERAAERPHFLVVGGGMVGSELTAALVEAGVRVTLIVRTAPPLASVLGVDMAMHLHAMHAMHGVEVIEGTVAELAGRGSRTVVRLSDGRRLEADQVVGAIGADKRTRLAAAAGISVDDGILVDARHRTSAPGIYAIGDVARPRGAENPGMLRSEHWESAYRDSEDLARILLGMPPIPVTAPWFWSERYGARFEMVGRLGRDTHPVVRESAAGPVILHVEEGVLVGASAIDDPTTIAVARQLIDSGQPLVPEALADPDVPLRETVRETR